MRASLRRLSQDYRLRRALKLPASHVYNVVGDVARYSEFVPYCLGSQIVDVDPTTGKPSRATLRIGWDRLDETFESELLYAPEKVVARAADNQMFRELHCEWTVRPIRDDQCLVALLLRFHFQSSLYNMVTQQFGPLISRKMVDAFSERSLALYRPPNS